MITQEQFQRVTREPRFPDSLSGAVKGGSLEYFCNTLVSYALKGVHTTLNVIWDWEPPAGIRRHALRVLSRHQGARRGAAGGGGPLPARSCM